MNAHPESMEHESPDAERLRPGRCGRSPMTSTPQPSQTRREWPSVELPAPLAPRPEISHVLFDFDGTISLIRQGWPDVMVPMFVEALPRLPGETEADIRRLVVD